MWPESNAQIPFWLFKSVRTFLFFCSENILELSIMPKDEDVLQLVSVSIILFLFSPLSFLLPHCIVLPLLLASLVPR